jgi:uncharacterized protein involved in exopolysaccharide biosynthesis
MIATLLSFFYDEARRLWYYKWTLAVTATLILVGSALYIARMPSVFDAWTQVLVNKETPLVLATQGGLGLGHVDDGNAAVAEKLLLNDSNLLPIVRQLNPAVASMSSADQARAINGLRSGIRITADQDDGLVEIHFADADPVRARDVVRDLLNAFITQSSDRSRKQLDQASQFLDQQIAAYQTTLSTSQSRLVDYRKQHPVVASVAPAPITAAEVGGAPSGAAQPVAATVSPALAATNQKIESLQSQLTGLRTQYTDQYPDVVSVKRQLDNAMSQRAQEQSLAPPSAGAVASKVRRYSRPRYRRAVAVPPEVAAQWSDLQRNDELLHINYQQLVTKRDAVALSLAAYGSDGASRYQVVRAPVVPALAAGPSRSLYLMLAAIVALTAGLAAAYLRGAVSGVFVSPRELETAFQLPVVGTVSWESAWDNGESRRAPIRLPLVASMGVVAALGLVVLGLTNLDKVSQLGSNAISALLSISDH